MADTAEIFQFPGRRDDAQAPGPERSGRSPQVEDGFTRIANELLEDVMAAPLTLREMRTVLAIIRLTYGWNRKQARVTGGLLAKLTGMPATKASQTLSSLVEKGVIIRHGGSRSPVSLNKHADQWAIEKTERKTPPPKQVKQGENNQTGKGETKGYDSHQNGKSESYQNGNASKDMKDIPPLPSVEGEGNSPKTEPKGKAPGAKPKAKPTQLDLSKLPADVTAEAVQGFIEHRKALKKPLTQRALNLNVNEALRAAERIPDLTADQALDETVLAGWQGVKADWLARRLSTQQRAGSGMNQADRLHAANQQAIREAVARRQSSNHDNADDLLDGGGHW